MRGGATGRGEAREHAPGLGEEVWGAKGSFWALVLSSGRVYRTPGRSFQLPRRLLAKRIKAFSAREIWRLVGLSLRALDPRPAVLTHHSSATALTQAQSKANQVPGARAWLARRPILLRRPALLLLRRPALPSVDPLCWCCPSTRQTPPPCSLCAAADTRAQSATLRLQVVHFLDCRACGW